MARIDVSWQARRPMPPEVEGWDGTLVEAILDTEIPVPPWFEKPNE